jgi:hypothetical protein
MAHAGVSGVHVVSHGHVASRGNAESTALDAMDHVF